jgi:AcrR family transcriptional regulator
MSDDKREETRARLLEAAAHVFAKKGYEGASVDDVAHAAGFTKGAVYWHFASKEDLFLELVRRRDSILMGEFFAAAANAAPEGYVSELASVYGRHAPDPSEWKLWMEFVLYALRKPSLTRRMRKEGEEAYQALVATLDTRLAEREGTPPLSTELLARLYLALFTGVNQQRAIDPASVDDELFPRLLHFIERAYDALAR